MIFDFDDLINFLKYFNYNNNDINNNFQDFDDMPLKVRNILKNKIWNKTTVSLI